MTALAVAGIALFAVALAAIGIALARRIPAVVRAIQRDGVRGSLLAWALRTQADEAARRGYDTPSRARWPRG